MSKHKNSDIHGSQHISFKYLFHESDIFNLIL